MFLRYFTIDWRQSTNLFLDQEIVHLLHSCSSKLSSTGLDTLCKASCVCQLWLFVNLYKCLYYVEDAMSIRLPDASPTGVSPMTICLLRWFDYVDLPTIFANLTLPNLVGESSW